MTKSNDWKTHKEYVEDGLIVRINVLQLSEPVYSVEIGTLTSDGFVRRHVPAEKMPEVLALLEKAMNEHAETVKKNLEIQEKSAEAKRDKKKRYLENVEKRRAENRQRAARN